MERQSLLQKKQTFKLANSSLCCKYIDDVITLASQNEFSAIEWDLNFIPPTLSKHRQYIISEMIEQTAIEVRYHLPYSYIEIAHQDDDIRTMSMFTLQQYINFIAQLNGHYAILHIGYNEESQASIALDSLNSLAGYSERLGVQLCVENLIKGLTTDECFLNDALSVPNVAFCLDTGHADVIIKKNNKFFYGLDANISKIYHAHCYKTEDNYYNHLPFSSIDEVEKSQVFLLLLKSECSWLTMELDQQNDQNLQMRILKNYLNL